MSVPVQDDHGVTCKGAAFAPILLEVLVETGARLVNNMWLLGGAFLPVVVHGHLVPGQLVRRVEGETALVAFEVLVVGPFVCEQI